MTRACLVLGQGQIGQLLASAMAENGVTVTVSDVDGWREAIDAHCGWVLLSLNRGTDSTVVADHLARGNRTRIDGVIDLTTQTLNTVAHCTDVLAAAGIGYWAGGLTGGAGGLRRREAVFLLGPEPVAAPIVDLLEPMGEIIAFPDPASGVAGKLLHNYVLFANSHALAVALAEGMHRGCVDAMLRAIETGPAGRPTSAQSIVRDVQGRGRTSYSVRLVRKDLAQLAASFDGLPVLANQLLAEVDRLTAACDGDEPFTMVMAEGVRASFGERRVRDRP